MAHLSFCSSLDDTMANYPHCDCGEIPWRAVPVGLAHMLRNEPPMPKTSKEKQEDYRARMALLGMKEVRGIYLPESLHPALKEHAARLLAQHKPEERK